MTQSLAATDRRTVLTVDDDMLVNIGTAAMLEELGHVVLEAASAREALDLLDARADIDLLITDQTMPGMSGCELIRSIQGRRPGFPVILATGHAELPQDGPADIPHIRKPFRQAELSEAIAQALNQVPATP